MFYLFLSCIGWLSLMYICYQGYYHHRLHQRMYLYRPSVLPVEKSESTKEIEIFFTGGGFFYPYFVGIADYLMTVLNKEEARKKILFTGMSAGNCATIACVLSLYGIASVRDVYDRFLSSLSFFILQGGSMFKHSEHIWHVGYDMMSYYVHRGLEMSMLNESMGIYLSVSHSLCSKAKRLLVRHVENAADFADAMLCSAFIPVVFGHQISSHYRGMHGWDAMFTPLCPPSQGIKKRIVIDLLPEKHKEQQVYENDIMMNGDHDHWSKPYVFTKGQLYALDREHMDVLYRDGYEWAKKHLHKTLFSLDPNLVMYKNGKEE